MNDIINISSNYIDSSYRLVNRVIVKDNISGVVIKCVDKILGNIIDVYA